MNGSVAGRIWWHAATLAEPGVRLMLRQRLARGKELPDRVAERRGRTAVPRPAGALLWLHAASVGEMSRCCPCWMRCAASIPGCMS